MTDRIVILFAFVVLAGFLGVLVVEVPRLDLGIVVAVTLLLVGYDFLRMFRNGGE